LKKFFIRLCIVILFLTGIFFYKVYKNKVYKIKDFAADNTNSAKHDYHDRTIQYATPANNKKYNKTIQDATDKIKNQPKNYANYIVRGITYSYKGLYDEAIADFNYAIKLNRELYDACNGLVEKLMNIVIQRAISFLKV